MALRTSKVSVYCSNIRQLTSRLRVLSVPATNVERATIIEQQPVKHDTNAVQNGTFGGNKQFPFPGGVTSQIAYKNIQHEPEVVATLEAKPVKNAAVEAIDLTAGDFNEKNIEIKALSCPEPMKKKASELFPTINADDLCVLNVTQKTVSDMSAWNANMEVEWIALSSGFIDSAIAICDALKSFGYWADFIDPTTGKPYLNKTNSNVTLNTTDDEYRSLGFEIVDMVCCKVLKHSMWGKKVFVGTIFTTAPMDSPAVHEILTKANIE